MFGVPSFKDVFDVVDAEAKFQKVTIAKEAIEQNPKFYAMITSWAQKEGVKINIVPHDELKLLSKNSKAVVRTGECTAYSNVVLESNVSF